jgi:hypothetical protein
VIRASLCRNCFCTTGHKALNGLCVYLECSIGLQNILAVHAVALWCLTSKWRYAFSNSGLIFLEVQFRSPPPLLKVRNRIVSSAAARAILHCQDGAEAGLAVHNALICLRSFGQRIRFDHCFHFSLGHEVERFVKIFGAILLASNDTNASHK